MALWKETLPATAGASQPSAAAVPPERLPSMRAGGEPGVATPGVATPGVAGATTNRPTPRTTAEGDSLIGAGLNIEGKIEGTGNVRIAGRFKGDVRIDGNFSIETGAQLTGQVVAAVVVVGGDLQGNIESARRVEVLDGGSIVGDVKAGSITVAAGSRMHGHVEFGWDGEKPSIKPGLVSSR